MTEFSLESLQQTLLQLLDAHTNPSLKKAAEAYLLDFQKTQIAWGISLQLLASQNPHVQLFGAQTLYNKLQIGWESFLESDVNAMQTTLVEVLAREDGAQSPWFVAAKVSQVIVVLVLRSRPTNPQDFLRETVSYLAGRMEVSQNTSSPINSAYFAKTILELTALVPEEMQKLEISDVVKKRMVAAIHTLSVPSAEFSVRMSSHPDPSVRRIALRCISSWVQHELLPVDTLVIVLQSLLHELQNGSEFETVASAIAEILGEHRLRRLKNTVCGISLEVLTSPSIYNKLVYAIRDEDESVVRHICIMLTELGENHVEYFWENILTPSVSKALDMLLDIIEYPGYFGVDQDVTGLPFYFLFLFQETATEQMEVWTHDDIGGVHSAMESRLNQIYARLLKLLCSQVKYAPLADMASWSSDNRDQFKSHRSECADTLLCCYAILSDRSLELVCSAIGQQIDHASSLTGMHPIEVRFRGTFFLLGAFSETIDSKENTYLAQILNARMLKQIDAICTPNDTSGLLRNTTLSVLGSFSPWLSKNPHDIGAIFEYILTSILIPRSCLSASSALRQVCDSCRISLAPYADQVVNACISALPSVERVAYNKIIESLSMVIQALPHDVASPRLNMVLNGIVVELGGMLHAAKSAANISIYRHDVLVRLGYLKSCCHGAIPSEDSSTVPVNLVDVAAAPNEQEQQVGLDISNTIHATIAMWSQDEEMIQAACAVVNEISRSDLSHLVNQSSALLSFFLDAIKSQPRTCYLRVVATLTEYVVSRQMDTNTGLSIRREMFTVLCTHIADRFTTLEYMENNPDVVDEFVRMLYSFLVMYGSLAVQMDRGFICTVISTVMIQGLKLQERLAISTILRFVTDFVNSPFEAVVVEHIVKDVMAVSGSAIVGALLTAIGGGLPRSLIDRLSDTMFVMVYKHPLQTIPCIRTWLDMQDFPTNRVSYEQKAMFIKAISSTRQSKAFRTALRAFSSQCRGLDAVGFG
ncbi:hypothetical protein BASA61_003729 [Batrachochytrium salamandrivorans]|nr:hypothetical protein BASA61_003729 [Batrachochytrium salamandrivorans]